MSSKKGSSSSAKAKATKPAKEAVPAIQPRKLLVNGPQRQVFIIDDADKLGDVSSVQCVSLLHPKHGKPCRYLYTFSHIWELQRVYQPPSSWIMGHDIQEDGSFYLATIIDPLFLVLPLLDKGRNKTADREGNFMQLDQLLPKAEFPVALLSSGSGRVGATASAHTLCDVRDGWNDKVVRLSDEKVVAWLRKKAARMVHSFKRVPALKHLYSDAERASPPEAETAHVVAAPTTAAASPSSADGEEQKESGAQATAADSSASATPSPAPAAASAASAGLKQALAFLSEYLPPHFFLLLLASYSLDVADVFEKKRGGARWGVEGGGKISGDIDTSRPAGAAPTSENKRKAEKPISAAAKKLATAAKGTKSLASFFTKKAT